jgi:hypothetical protein
MTLKAFFQIPLVKFIVHVLLVVGVGLNIFHFYRVWDMQQKIEAERRQLSILRQENSDARNQRDYYASDLYKEKFAKEQNFKMRGEEVIDTSVLDSTGETKSNNYIPKNLNQNKSNVQKWWEYFFAQKKED